MSETNNLDPVLAQASAQVRNLEAMVGRAVIGQRQVIREVIVALVAGGHVLVEGLPGLGKTLLVRSLSKAVGGVFSRVQFTPDLMPSDISGHAMFDMKSEEFRIRRGPIFCNFLLGDEINRAPAKTQSALLEAMQEEQVTIEGKPFRLEQPFLVMATQNPVDPGDGDAEPGGTGRHLSVAAGAAGSLPAQRLHRLSQRTGRGSDDPPGHRQCCR